MPLCLVPVVGLEPTRYCYQRILSEYFFKALNGVQGRSEVMKVDKNSGKICTNRDRDENLSVITNNFGFR